MSNDDELHRLVAQLRAASAGPVDPPDDAIPMLTEVVELPRYDAAELPQALTDVDWAQLALRVQENVLERLLGRSETLIDDEMQVRLDIVLARATEFRDANIATCDNLDAFHAHWQSSDTPENDNPGWLYTPWAGTPEQEEELSKQHKITIRCLPIPEADLPAGLASVGDKCILTGETTAVRALWGRSY